MKRLIHVDHQANSPEALLASLVHASAQREPAPIDRQRVLRAVTAASRPARFGGVSLTAAAAALSFAAVAAASIGGVVTLWHHRSAVAVTALSPASSPVAPSAAAPPTGESSPVEPPAPGIVPLPSTTPGDLVVPPSKSADAPGARLRAPSKSLRDGEDPTPVLEAIRALRQDGDPARATDLLSGYLRMHPRGVLAEDALALSIEAALARHDPRAASELARRYVARFPNGRYRAFALRAGRN